MTRVALNLAGVLLGLAVSVSLAADAKPSFDGVWLIERASPTRNGS